VEDANAELEKIDPFCRHLPEVLLARLAIYHGLKKWKLLAVVAKKLADWNSKEPGFLVELAYATRRCESIHAAHAILTRGAGLHPTDGTIQFNLCLLRSAVGQSRPGQEASEASDRDQRQVQIDGAGTSGFATPMELVGPRRGMSIIEVRPCKKFKGAWVAFEVQGVEPAFAEPNAKRKAIDYSCQRISSCNWKSFRPVIICKLSFRISFRHRCSLRYRASSGTTRPPRIS
jgi:hypothetical protein